MMSITVHSLYVRTGFDWGDGDEKHIDYDHEDDGGDADYDVVGGSEDHHGDDIMMMMMMMMIRTMIISMSPTKKRC